VHSSHVHLPPILCKVSELVAVHWVPQWSQDSPLFLAVMVLGCFWVAVNPSRRRSGSELGKLPAPTCYMLSK